MSKRVSHGADRKRSQSLSARRADSSLLDPWIGPALKSVYHVLPIPRWFPPEGIVLTGHLLALAGAVGFAYSTSAWWGGLLLALGVVGNHTADCIDGTHARSTDQCRNGGELLDHFTDPLSFSYWMAGWGIACDRLDLGIAAVICIYATAVLTSIKAKMMGEFTLASFGPTEFKTLLAIFGLVMAALVAGGERAPIAAGEVALRFFQVMLLVGIVQLVVNLVLAVREVNEHGGSPDTSEWETTRAASADEETEEGQRDTRID